MKQLVSLLLVLLFVCSPLSVFAAEGEQTLSAPAYQNALYGAVKNALPGEEVVAATQAAYLCSDSAVRTGATGVPLPVEKGQTKLSGGDVVRMTADGMVKICTVAYVQKTLEDETVTVEERTFELKNIFLTRGSRFSVSEGARSLIFTLHFGTMAYAYVKDPFLAGAFTLVAGDAEIFSDETYLSLSVTEEETFVFNLSSSGETVLKQGEKKSALRAGEGVRLLSDGMQEAFPLPFSRGGEAGAFSFVCDALVAFAPENSALADGLLRALSVRSDSGDVNVVRDAYLAARQARRVADTRAHTLEEAGVRTLRLTADDVIFRDFRAAIEREKQNTEWILYYPKSSAAYTVIGDGKRVNLSELLSEEILQITVSLSVPLSERRDSLSLRLGEKTYPVYKTEGLSSYIFRVPVSELKLLYVEDPAPKSFEVSYSTEKTYLFVEEKTATYALTQTDAEVRAGEAYTLEVKLAGALYEGDELYLSFTDAKGETHRVSPTAVPGKPSVYLFTVTPQTGANFAEVVCSSMYEVHVDNALGTAFSVQWKNTAGTGLAAGGTCPTLRIFGADDSDFVPVVLQKSGNESRALSPDAYGVYRAEPIGADTVFSFSLGYPVYLPREEGLYFVEPLAGFARDYAPCDGEWRFKVQLSQDMALGTSILVKNNGVTLTPDSEGTYIIAEVTQPIRLTITHGVTYNVFLPNGENFTVSPYGGDGTTVLENGTFRFTLQTLAGAEKDGFIVAANESVLTPDPAGIYTVSGIKRDVYITVRFVSSFRVILPQGDGFTAAPVSESEGAVLLGGTYQFTVQTDESVHKDSRLFVFANEAPLTPDEAGVYTVENIQSDVYITVRLVRAYAVTLPEASELFEIQAPEERTVLYGESYTFTVLPKTSYALNVYINGRPVTGVAGTYTVSRVYSDLYVSVSVSSQVQTYAVTLQSAGGLDVQALSSATVLQGGEFNFSVTLPQGVKEEDLEIRVSCGTLSLVSTQNLSDASVILTYRILGIPGDCNVSILKKESGV